MAKKKYSQEEYREFIQQSVSDGSFFKDSFDWYVFRYVGPICDRTWLFFITIASSIIAYALIVMIMNAFPIVQKTPITIKAKDTVLYYPKITALRDSKDLRTIEEAVVKHLLINYLKEREEFDFSKLNTNALNRKFNIIKNNSTASEFRRFQSMMSLNNNSSPIRNFGKNVTRKVAIQSFSFKRKVNEDFIDKAKEFVYTQIPSSVDIAYKVQIAGAGKVIQRNYIARISFRFSRIDNRNLNQKIDFKVSDYKILNNGQNNK